MNIFLKGFCCITILIAGISYDANATSIDDWGNGLHYYIFEKNLKFDDAADTLGIPPEFFGYGKVEDGNDEDNEGISWLNGSNNMAENEGFSITTWGTQSEDGKYYLGTWESDIPLWGYSLKADGYTLLVELEVPAMEGDWDLNILWNWIADNDPNERNPYPGLSNFGGYAPIPEPATMLLLGVGLVGMAGLGRKKLFKKP